MKNCSISTSWSEKAGISLFTIQYKNEYFTGTATCCEEDKEFKSEIFGEALADNRATRKYFAFIRDNEIIPQLKALNQLYYSMKHSSQFNPKSYEAKMLFRQIKQREEDLKIIKFLIQDLRDQETMLKRSLERTKEHRKKKEPVQ